MAEPDEQIVPGPGAGTSETPPPLGQTFLPDASGVAAGPPQPPLTLDQIILQAAPATRPPRVSPVNRPVPPQTQADLKSLYFPETAQQKTEAQETIFSRIGGGLLAAADWIQRFVDAPTPGAIALTSAAASRTDVGAFQAVTAQLDFLFTGSNELIETELKKLGVEPLAQADTVAGHLLNAWKTYGEFQAARPDAFWGEKFISELLLSPANLLPFGILGRSFMKAGMVFPRMTRALAWNQTRFNPLQLTRTARQSVSQRYFQENLGMTMAALDPHTGRALQDFPEAQQYLEAKRRLVAFYEGDETIKGLWGSMWKGNETQRTHKFLRKAFNTKDDFEVWLDEDAPQYVAGMLHEAMKRVSRVAAGPGALKQNMIMRGQQKLKREILGPVLLGGTLRYPIYNAMTNSVTLGFRHGINLYGLPSALKNTESLGITKSIFGDAAILKSETTGLLREYTAESGRAVDSVEEWAQAAVLTRTWGIGGFFKFGTKLAKKNDDWARRATFSMTAMKVWRSEWKRELKRHGLNRDETALLSSVLSPDDMKNALARLLPGTDGPSLSALDLTPTGDLSDAGRIFWDESVEVIGHQPRDIADLNIIGQRTKQNIRAHYRRMADEGEVEFGNVNDRLITEYDGLIEDMETFSRVRKLDGETRDAIKTEIARLKEQRPTFSRDMQLNWLNIEAGAQRVKNAGYRDVVRVHAVGEVEERVADIKVQHFLRDRRQIEQHYRNLREIVPSEAAKRVPELTKAHALKRTAINNEFSERIIKIQDEFVAAMDKVPKDELSGISMSDLEIPSALPRVQLHKIMEDVGLDPAQFSPDDLPNMHKFVLERGQREAKMVDDMLAEAASNISDTRKGLFARGAGQGEKAEALLAGYNRVRAKTQRVATESTQQGFFDYGWRNYMDYAQNHLMPFPFWGTRYMVYWATRSIQNPAQLRIALRIIAEYQKSSQDEAPHLRFSKKVKEFDDGTQIRYSPLGGLLPIASPFIDAMSPGRETTDAIQIMAKIQDFAGGYLFPTTELAFSMADAFGFDLTRSGARGLARKPKEIVLDMVPQLALLLTGINALGYERIVSQAGNSFLTEKNKNAMLFAIADDLNTGALTDMEAAREAVRSIVAGQPNSLAAGYAKKVFGRSFLSRATGLLGVPLRISTRGERVTAEARARILPEAGQPGPHPDEVKLIYDAFPGLTITQGQILPSGMNQEQQELFRITADYHESTRDLRERREEELQVFWDRLIDPNNPLTGEQYREERSRIWAAYSAGTSGSLVQTIERTIARGLDIDLLPLPVAPDEQGRIVPVMGSATLARQKRQQFWVAAGRIIYPDNPFRLIEDGYYNISPDQFRSEETGLIDWSGFFGARAGYIESLLPAEQQFLAARVNSEDNADAGYRRAQEAVSEYWMLRDDLAARDDRLDDLSREISLAQKRGDQRRVQRLQRHPALRRFERDLARARQRLRRQDRILDGALALFWGYTPVHRNSVALARQEFFGVV